MNHDTIILLYDVLKMCKIVVDLRKQIYNATYIYHKYVKSRLYLYSYSAF